MGRREIERDEKKRETFFIFLLIYYLSLFLSWTYHSGNTPVSLLWGMRTKTQRKLSIKSVDVDLGKEICFRLSS
jgi:hypothetical protein